DQNLSCSRRDASTVPTQALTLLNDEFVLKQAELLAGRVAEAAPGDPEKQIEVAYQIALNRPPRPEERSVARAFLAQHKLVDLTHVLLNLNEFLYLR
ncbi:MAG TPA: DUF1553 domain-containing protein, partial [Bryobacteraceae bacterium]|nr:DUF1553 domain-containing protein [Bryobacteraceae bacterium]